MTANQALANAMFPDITKTPDDYEALYPPRALPEGARVTRIAPSPTGYLHLGVFFTALVNRLTASATGGVFYFRLEDTDKKREVEGGAADILRGMNEYGLAIDEGFTAPGEVRGDYGPYQQSQRVEIYQAYVKSLVEQGLAYPCFCTEEDRQAAVKNRRPPSSAPGITGLTPSAGTSPPRRRCSGWKPDSPMSCGCALPGARKTGSSLTTSSRAALRCPKMTRIWCS